MVLSSNFLLGTKEKKPKKKKKKQKSFEGTLEFQISLGRNEKGSLETWAGLYDLMDQGFSHPNSLWSFQNKQSASYWMNFLFKKASTHKRFVRIFSSLLCAFIHSYNCIIIIKIYYFSIWLEAYLSSFWCEPHVTYDIVLFVDLLQL